ncbi:MAG TPA: hypothetical protein VHV75_10540 [Solirubrobacteraceae bacterium]|nr:hypothetical protein [Solirubrobacteraceae bacterium]
MPCELCLIYLAIFSFHPVGLAVMIVVGSLVVTMLGRPGDAIVTNITTAVLLVLAGLDPPTPGSSRFCAWPIP